MKVVFIIFFFMLSLFVYRLTHDFIINLKSKKDIDDGKLSKQMEYVTSRIRIWKNTVSDMRSILEGVRDEMQKGQ